MKVILLTIDRAAQENGLSHPIFDKKPSVMRLNTSARW
jgi:hypothetical protein